MEPGKPENVKEKYCFGMDRIYLYDIYAEKKTVFLFPFYRVRERFGHYYVIFAKLTFS